MSKTTYILTAILFINTAFAQDIKGGEVRFSHVSDNTFSFDVFLYTQTSMGLQHTGVSTNLPGDITEWHYNITHTYPGPGTYNFGVTDSFRLSNIQNILNSSAESIFLKASLEINPFIGSNSSVILNSKPSQFFTDGSNIFHDPDALDPDGDSLSFSLVPATTSNYTSPPGATLDPVTGIFQMPFSTGNYAINIEIKEFRDGYNISTTYREMIVDSAALTNITSINSEEYNFLVFPNPTSGSINIVSSNDLKEVVLFDLTGKKIMAWKNLSNNTINLVSLCDGFYTLQIIDENGNKVVRKIVKNQF
jgi:hypothetical protein